MRSEERLAKEGWKRMNTIDEPRLSELVAMYKETGNEVHLEPVDLDEMTECDECIRLQPERYKTIYIRPAADGTEGEMDDLF
jgi:hypothetical protein